MQQGNQDRSPLIRKREIVLFLQPTRTPARRCPVGAAAAADVERRRFAGLAVAGTEERDDEAVARVCQGGAAAPGPWDLARLRGRNRVLHDAAAGEDLVTARPDPGCACPRPVSQTDLHHPVACYAPCPLRVMLHLTPTRDWWNWLANQTLGAHTLERRHENSSGPGSGTQRARPPADGRTATNRRSDGSPRAGMGSACSCTGTCG